MAVPGAGLLPRMLRPVPGGPHCTSELGSSCREVHTLEYSHSPLAGLQLQVCCQGQGQGPKAKGPVAKGTCLSSVDATFQLAECNVSLHAQQNLVYRLLLRIDTCHGNSKHMSVRAVANYHFDSQA